MTMKQSVIKSGVKILVILPFCAGFSLPGLTLKRNVFRFESKQLSSPLKALSVDNEKVENEETSRTLSAASLEAEPLEISIGKKEDEPTKSSAKTNTVNERLMAELQAATEAERGPKTAWGKQLKESFKYSDKTNEEREAALEAARDLNGLNPIVTISASFLAFGMAYGFWSMTQFLGDLFLSHPVSPDAPYTFARMASVIRNAVMGLSSLASGFAAVSGLGVFLLGIRVAYGEKFIYQHNSFMKIMKMRCTNIYVCNPLSIGVAVGELDPTPIKPSVLRDDEIEIPNVWNLMMNKNPNKRSRR